MDDIIKLVNNLFSKVHFGEITQSALEQELKEIAIKLEDLLIQISIREGKEG